jgi:VanZ family protein
LPFLLLRIPGSIKEVQRRTEKREVAAARAGRRNVSRLWRYGPLLVWMGFIFWASTAQLSASNTSRFIKPLVLWLFPHLSEEGLTFVHVLIRKLAHLTEYAILGLLAAHAFITSSRQRLRRRWFLFSLLLVAIYALSDELHQRFVPVRTGSIYDSLIDIAGGLIALAVLALWRNLCNSFRQSASTPRGF